MRIPTWMLVVVFGVVAALMLRSLFRPKPQSPKPRREEAEPPLKGTAIVDGEVMEVESVSGEELERIAMSATMPEPEDPSEVEDESRRWRDVMADSSSVSIRRSTCSSSNLREAAKVLSKAGIPYRVAPSAESLLGINTLQVLHADFDRAIEALRCD